MQPEHNEPRHARATQDYRVQYTDPIRVSSGEVVHVGHEDTDDRRWWWCSAAPTGGKAGCPSTFSLRPPPRAKWRMYGRIMRPPSSRSTVVRRSWLSNSAENRAQRRRAARLGTRLTCGAARAPGASRLTSGQQGGLVETNGERTKI